MVAVTGNDDKEMMYHSPVYTLPQGVYEIQDIVGFINDKTLPFDIFLEQKVNQRIVLNINFQTRSMYLQTSGTPIETAKGNGWYHYGDVSNATIKYPGIMVEIYFSSKLHYILGNFKNSIKRTFDESVKGDIFCISAFSDNDKKAEKDESQLISVECERLPDANAGLNKILVYCDQVEKSLVGNVEANLLTVIPLQYKGQGSISLVDQYRPPLVRRKLIKNKIEKFDIQLKDAEGNLINFDSGSVNIQCIIQ